MTIDAAPPQRMDPGSRVLSAHARRSRARAAVVLPDPFDLELQRGEVVAVLGPNGVGKSTLLATLAGLLPPAGGRVERHGRVAAALQAPALARRSVRANVEAALAWWGVPRGERRRARRGRARAPARRAARGAARRRALRRRGAAGAPRPRARAARRTRCCSTSRSPASTADARRPARDAVRRALRDADRATMVVVHDRAEAWALADRLIVLLDGRVAAQGTPAPCSSARSASRSRSSSASPAHVREPDGSVRYVRPVQVTLDRSGGLQGRVTRRVPEEDGVLCVVALEDGEVQVRSPYPGPARRGSRCVSTAAPASKAAEPWSSSSR